MLALALSVLAWDENDVARIVSTYKPLRKHPALFDAKAGWSRWIEPRLLDALAELKAGNESAVRSLLRVEVEGSDASVYSFAIFTTDFCDRFIEELDNYYATGLPQPRPNSMNNYGIIVNQIGMQAVITRMQREVLLPLSELLFPVQARGGFTGHHSFMVKYTAGEDLGLDMHTDDSDVTFNMCLGRVFSGAKLTLCGDSRQPEHRQFYHHYEHVRGRALIHLGSRRHGADDITAGERNNLIVWNQNQRYRDSAEYVNKQPYHKEEAPPDPRCLSYTHDRDFGSYLDYPPGKQDHAGRGWCPPDFACYDSMDAVLAGKDEL